MFSVFNILRIVSALCIGVILLPFPAAAQAAGNGWYVGADVTRLWTTLDVGSSDVKFATSHARLKGGYQFLKYLSVEGRVMSSGDDTDSGANFDTGTMFGIYARPHTNFHNANVYGIVGLTVMNTEYAPGSPLPAVSDSVTALTVGVGGSFRLVDNFTLDVEALAYSGKVDYGSNYPDDPRLYGVGLSAGICYRF